MWWVCCGESAVVVDDDDDDDDEECLLVWCLKDSGFWDEVKHYRSVNKRVNELCASNATSVISESVWNAEFRVTPEFCRLFTDDLLEQLQALYERQYPTDIAEKKPSRHTC